MVRRSLLLLFMALFLPVTKINVMAETNEASLREQMFATITGQLLITDVTGLIDASLLARVADSVGIPRVIMWSIAWEESSTGVKGNKVLGPLVKRHECRAIGRMQVNPCTGWARIIGPECSRKNLLIYSSNLRCGAEILKYQYARFGWAEAVRMYNGKGPIAKRYRRRVLKNVKRYVMNIPLLLR